VGTPGPLELAAPRVASAGRDVDPIDHLAGDLRAAMREQTV
jgi:hypothetical protein